MSGIEELVAAALEAYEAAVAIKDGVTEAWDKLKDGYDYISTYFSVPSDAHGHYSDVEKSSKLWAKLWVHPQDFKKFLDIVGDSDISNTSHRALLYSAFHNLQTRPYWLWGFRFPDDVLIPIYDIHYRTDYVGMYTSLNSISLAIKYNLLKELPSYIDNFNNHYSNIIKLYAGGISFSGRDEFESINKLKWFRT